MVVVFMQDAPRMPERKEGRNKHSMPTKTLGKSPTTHAPNLHQWGLRPQSQCRMPPVTDPDSPAALNPTLVALSRSNMFAHTLAPMVMSASLSTQLLVRKAAQIQPFLAVPHGSKPPLPRQ